MVSPPRHAHGKLFHTVTTLYVPSERVKPVLVRFEVEVTLQLLSFVSELYVVVCWARPADGARGQAEGNLLRQRAEEADGPQPQRLGRGAAGPLGERAQ